MTTTDGKNPRLEIVYPHDDGDIVIILEATFRGDVRKLMTEPDVEKEDAELAVASNLFRILQLTTQGPSDQAEDGSTQAED